MRFLFDANLPRSLADIATRAGDDGVHVADVGLGAATDDDIAAYARQAVRVLVTRDLDVADVRAYPPGSYAGIVVLRLPERATVTDIRSLFEQLLRLRDVLERLEGRLAIVDEERVRVRPPLP